MFNLFRKKKSTKNYVNESNSGFLSEFSDEQKAAMIYSLMLLSSANGNYNEEKLAFTENQAGTLKFNLEGVAMINQMERKADYAYSIIKRFSSKQKDWYSILLGSGMFIGGNPTDNEKKIAQIILDSTGISNLQFDTANNKANAIMNKFLK